MSTDKIISAAADIMLGKNKDGSLDSYVIGQDGVFYSRSQVKGGKWGTWAPGSDAGLFAPGSSVTSVLDGNGKLINFAVATNGHVYSREQQNPGGDWTSWSDQGSSQIFEPGSVVNPFADSTHRIDLYVIDAKGTLHTRSRTVGSTWSDWSADSDEGKFVPGCRVSSMETPTRVLNAAIGVDGCLYVRQRLDDGLGWGVWEARSDSRFPAGAAISMIADAPGTLWIQIVGKDGVMWFSSMDAQGEWSEWLATSDEKQFIPGSPVTLTSQGNRIYGTAVNAKGRVVAADGTNPETWTASSWKEVGNIVTAPGTMVSAASDLSGKLFMTVVDAAEKIRSLLGFDDSQWSKDDPSAPTMPRPSQEKRPGVTTWAW
ncbi:MAG: hypothetical protein LBM23_01065 [Propionibacteriaceae bacterium]|jgi:hypothetical protein|nr:hypothetical protein [Propionibacteriaceae bacterium]